MDRFSIEREQLCITVARVVPVFSNFVEQLNRNGKKKEHKNVQVSQMQSTQVTTAVSLQNNINVGFIIQVTPFPWPIVCLITSIGWMGDEIRYLEY